MLPRLAFRLIAVVLAATALSGSLTAQNFDLATHGQQIIALDQLMRFHPGDDPTLAWANPALDDSSWPLIRGDETWYAQGYPKLTGFAWYRFKVTLPSHSGPLALWVPLIATNFQIYADGRLIAENGAMPPHPRPRYGPNLVFPIPADLAHSGQPLSFAIRVWHYQWEYQLFGGLQESMQLGDASLIREWQAQRWREIFWVNTQFNINWPCLPAGRPRLPGALLPAPDRPRISLVRRVGGLQRSLYPPGDLVQLPFLQRHFLEIARGHPACRSQWLHAGPDPALWKDRSNPSLLGCHRGRAARLCDQRSPRFQWDQHLLVLRS